MKKLDEKRIQQLIQEVDGTMAMEGMPLSAETKQKIHDCLTGKSSFEVERKKIIDECKRIYG